MSALFRWPCSISILLSPRSVTGVSLSIGHEAFLFICLPGPSLLVPCSISIHLSFRSVTGGVRPCPLAMKIHLSPMRLLSFGLSGLVPALLFSAA